VCVCVCVVITISSDSDLSPSHNLVSCALIGAIVHLNRITI